jgi:hypothetical protein
MRQFRLSAFELNHHDRALVRSLLELAEGKTRAEWFWLDNVAFADVVICAADSDDERAAVEARLAADGGPIEPIYLVEPDSPPVKDRLTIARPPRLANLIRWLNATQVLISMRTAQHDSDDASATGGVTFPSIYAALLDAFQKKAPGIFAVRGKPWETIYILPQLRQYLSFAATDDAMRATLSQSEGQVYVEPVRDAETQRTLLQRQMESARKLVWLAAITLPQIHQIGHIDPKKMYQLKRLPRFEGLMHREADLRMANTLMQTPMTVRGLALLSGASTSGARSFLMACYAARLLRSDKSQTGETTTLTQTPAVAATEVSKEPTLIRLRSSPGPRDEPTATG